MAHRTLFNLCVFQWALTNQKHDHNILQKPLIFFQLCHAASQISYYLVETWTWNFFAD